MPRIVGAIRISPDEPGRNSRPGARDFLLISASKLAVWQAVLC
jgi:hypothetical protein